MELKYERMTCEIIGRAGEALREAFLPQEDGKWGRWLRRARAGVFFVLVGLVGEGFVWLIHQFMGRLARFIGCSGLVA